MDLIYKNKKILTTILITGILFARCNIGLVYGFKCVGLNLIFDGLAFIFCCILFLNDKETTKKSVLNIAVLWLVIFFIEVFIYGYFKFGVSASFYSRQYSILTMFPAVLILIMLSHNKDDVVEIISRAGSVIIITTLIASLLFDSVWTEWLDGVTARVGATPAGTCLDTGNLMMIMLVPIFYQIIVKKKYKAYMFFALVGVFEIVVSGSKSSLLPLLLVIAIILIGASKDKKTLKRNIIILIALGVIGTLAILFIPPLYGIVGFRVVELFTGLNSKEYDLLTSTGQRLAVIAAFKEHFWENPILGHGFFAFKEMPYSQLEAYKVDGVRAFRNIQTHMNYLELLFSFGIVGFVLYYWLPLYLLIKSFFIKNKEAKLIVLSFMVSFFFMDLGIDMFYKYMFPYYSYLVAFCLLKNSSEN